MCVCVCVCLFLLSSSSCNSSQEGGVLQTAVVSLVGPTRAQFSFSIFLMRCFSAFLPSGSNLCVNSYFSCCVVVIVMSIFRFSFCQSVASFSTIGTDQGSGFNADVIRLVANFGLTFSRGSPYNSSTQDLVEAFNKTLRNMLARQTDESRTKVWLPFLDKIVGTYNR